jgi:hypothetical protein
MEPCINLLETLGDRYRITFDEAYEPRNVPREKLDPWMMQILCAGRGITIYPHGRDVLAVEVDQRPSVVAKLVALPGLRLWQDAEREKTFLFDVSLFDQVAQIVEPRRLRQLTESQLQTLRKYAFRPRDGAQKSSLERAPTPPSDIPIAQVQVGPLFST